MEAGRLRHRVTIRTPVDVTNDVGERRADYSTILATVQASIEDLAGRELLLAQQVNADLTTRVRIRYVAGVVPRCRVHFGSRILEVMGSPVNPDNRNVELILACRELTG